MLGAIAHVDPAWLSVQVESSRRVGTDDRFREQLASYALPGFAE